MMRSHNLNWHDHGGYTEMTAPSSNVNITAKDKTKETIAHETLLENNSTEVIKSERNFVNKTLSQNNSLDVSENTIT